MRTIWKYPLAMKSMNQLVLPMLAELLTVQVQVVDGEPVITTWWIVDVNREDATRGPRERVTVIIAGTGHELPNRCDKQTHVGTVQVSGYVWHVFVVERVRI